MSGRDQHSPGNFDPAAYELVGYFYIGPEPFPQDPSERETFALLGHSRYEGNFARKSSCDHCGASFHYGVAFRHRPSGDVIAVGEICANNAFAHENRRSYEMGQLRNRVKEFRERRKVSAEVAAFLVANPGLEEALKTDHLISRDLLSKMLKYGDLSEKQVAFAFRLQEQGKEKAERKIQDARERAAAPDWTAGRQAIEGTILSTKWQDSGYGGCLKMLVKLDDGRKCWGTVPSAIGETTDDEDCGKFRSAEQHRGLRVRFTGTIQVAKDDSKFAFFKRPAKAEVLTEVAA